MRSRNGEWSEEMGCGGGEWRIKRKRIGRVERRPQNGEKVVVALQDQH